MLIECLCGTHPHRLFLQTPYKPSHACAVKPEVLKSWSLEIDYSRAPCLGADQKARGLWERDWIETDYKQTINLERLGCAICDNPLPPPPSPLAQGLHPPMKINKIGPLHDLVKWCGIINAGTQITQWDFQNKGTRTSPARLPFVAKVPLCDLRPALFIPYHVTGSRKGPIMSTKQGCLTSGLTRIKNNAI